MQIAVKVLASLFAAAAGLALYAFGAVVYLALQHQTPGHHENPLLLEKLSIYTTALGLFALLYLAIAWLLATRVKWSLALILCGAALFGYPIGTVLALAAFVVLTRPSVRASFAK
jgi:hypothetical protein